MTERPIPFSAPMVRALLAGTKTQTRRTVVAPRWAKGAALECEFDSRSGVIGAKPWPWCNRLDGMGWWKTECPYGVPGDRLWVRETWADTNGENGPMISYRAGGDRFLVDESYPVDYSRYPNCTFAMWGGDLRRGAEGHSWRPSIFMPRWASRITLEVTGVRVERLQDISEVDAIAEGVNVEPNPDYRDGDDPWTSARPAVDVYRDLWGKINGAGSWDLNPWVWCVSFVPAPVSA